MKRILAIIMVLAMVFAFAACKPKDDGKDTTAPGVSGDAVTNDNNESVPADASEADSTDVSTDAAEVSTDASGKPVETPSQGGSQGGSQTGNQKGLNSTDAKAVVDFYNKAVKASVKNPPKGKQTMKLEKLEGTGGLGKIIGSFEGIAKKALEKNSTETTWIPAGDHGDVLPTDVKNAKAAISADGKYTIVSFNVNPQTDGRRRAARRVPSAVRSVLSETFRTLSMSFRRFHHFRHGEHKAHLQRRLCQRCQDRQRHWQDHQRHLALQGQCRC